MSKIVQIPECMWPNFTCDINGRKYSYPSGTTQEVPDEVAFVIENHVKKHRIIHEPAPAPTDVAQTDWNANEGEPGHVLNRTHYSTYESAILLDNQLIESMEPIDFKLVEGQTYHVVCDGTEFDNVAKSIDFNGLSLVAIGNDVFLGGDDTGEPYACIYIDGVGTQIMYDAESVTLSISTVQEVVHKLPEKYLPETTPFYFNVLARGLNFTAMVAVSKLDEAYASGRTIVLKLVISDDVVKLTHLLRLCSVGENFSDTIGNVYWFESSSYKCKLTPQEDGSYAVELTGGDSV